MRLLNFLAIILFTLAAIECAATTWAPAMPYVQQIDGQKIRVEAMAYDPHRGSPLPGTTKVYQGRKLLYSVGMYFREKIFTSDDGQYLAVVRTSNSSGIASNTVFGTEQIDFGLWAIAIYKNGILDTTLSLRDVIDTSRLLSSGFLFDWGYRENFERYTELEIGCRSCQEVYGKKVLSNCDPDEISAKECEECRKECDSLRLMEVGQNIMDNSRYVQDNALFVVTNQGFVVKLDFTTLQVERLAFEQVIPDKGSFSPPRLIRRYKKVHLPDKFAEPGLKSGESFEKAMESLFNLTANKNDEDFCVFVDMIINRNGKCVEFNGNVYDQRISEFFDKESIDLERTEKLHQWLREEIFQTNLIPRGFDKYAFCCIVNLK